MFDFDSVERGFTLDPQVSKVFTQALQEPAKLSLLENLSPLYKLVGADDEASFAVTLSSASALEHILNYCLFSLVRKEGRNHFIINSLRPLSMKEKGCLVQELPEITKEALAETITPRTALVSIPFADPFTGRLHDCRAIRSLTMDRGIFLHIDLSPSIAMAGFCWKECPADFLTFNGPHLYAPQGTGALFVHPHIKWREQEVFPSHMKALAEAASLSLSQLDFAATEISFLRNNFEEQLKSALPEIEILHNNYERVPHITAISFPQVHNEALAYLLFRKKIFANIDTRNTHTLSFVFSRSSAASQLDATVAAIKECYNNSRI